MAWPSNPRPADAIVRLRTEVDRAAPKRSKASDGMLGDASHASRDSDHNPWVRDRQGRGVVTALDITHDPGDGVDGQVIADYLRNRMRNGDERIKYIIWNRKIASMTAGRGGGAWRSYTGSNPHTKHVHVSVSDRQARYDDASPFGLRARLIRERSPAPAPKPPTPGTGTVKVRTGEGLVALAKRLGVAPEAIVAANWPRFGGRLQPGEELKRP